MHTMYAHMIDDFIGVKLGAELGGKQINVHSAHIGITPLVKPKSASSSDLSSLTLFEQLRRGAAGRIFILFSQALDLFSRSTVGIFPTICNDSVSDTMEGSGSVGIFPTIHPILDVQDVYEYQYKGWYL